MIRDCSVPALCDDLQIAGEIDGGHTRRRGSSTQRKSDHGGRRGGEESALRTPSKVVEVGLGCTERRESQRCEEQEEKECRKPKVLRFALAHVEGDGGGEKLSVTVLGYAVVHEAVVSAPAAGECRLIPFTSGKRLMSTARFANTRTNTARHVCGHFGSQTRGRHPFRTLPLFCRACSVFSPASEAAEEAPGAPAP